MARDKTVHAVRQAIESAFDDNTNKATNEAIIAASGVSSATFYRVLGDHPEVKQLLDVSMQAYKAGQGSTDIIAERPHAAVKQLRNVIAALVQKNAELREQLARYERERVKLLDQLPADTVTSLTPKSRKGSSAGR